MLNSIARPFGMLLMTLYELVGNYGLALLLFAIAVRAIMLPFQMKSKRGSMRMARLQPRLDDIKKRHGTNKTKVNEETAKLYKDEGVNPASGCLWSFLPIPIMLALFLVIRQPLTMMLGISEDLLREGGVIFEKLQQLDFVSTVPPYYVQVDQAQWVSRFFSQFEGLGIEGLRYIDFTLGPLNLGAQPDFTFLWNPNLELYGNWFAGFLLFLVPLFAGGSQFISTWLTRKTNPTGAAEGSGKTMQMVTMLMPLMTVYFAFITPAALGFYWTASTGVQIAQDLWLTKRFTRILDAEEEEKNRKRKIKEAELETKRLETERKKAEGLVERNPNTSKRKKQKSEKQEQLDKAVEWEKKNAPPAPAKVVVEPARVGKRRYARGRAYDPDRYKGVKGPDTGELSSGDEGDYEDDDSELLDEDVDISYSYDDEDDDDYEPDDDELDDESDDDESDDDEPDDD